MAITPAYQNKGIGKKLVFFIFEKHPNTEKIVLITEKGNIQSQAFYKAVGFQRSDFMYPGYSSDTFIGFEYTKE